MIHRRATRNLLVLVLMALLLNASGAAANPNQIQVFVNGQALGFDVPPSVINGRTLVPLRAIFEALGAVIEWDGETRTVTATWADGDLVLPIGKDTAKVNGQARKLDVPAQILQDRTMVPLRFVAEAIGAQVGWYGGSRLITINLPAKGLLQATVARVVDGDTVEVTLITGVTESIRLIGVDTPEVFGGVEPYGPEASAYTKGQLVVGQKVLLELDVEERDRYGRVLAYLYLANGTMFNGMLADDGYAQQLTIAPNARYAEVFRALVADAREASRGLWADRPVSEPAPGGGSYSGPYDPAGPDRDCGDFKTRAEAQAFFLAAGGPGSDRHRLDSDKDGEACETLP